MKPKSYLVDQGIRERFSSDHTRYVGVFNPGVGGNNRIVLFFDSAHSIKLYLSQVPKRNPFLKVDYIQIVSKGSPAIRRVKENTDGK